MYFYNAKERKSKELVPGATIRSFWGDKTLLSVVDIAPHSEVPKHTHPHEQSGMLLEGEVEMGVEGESKLLKPGDMYIIPGNVEHWARTKDKSALILDIFSPVREEYKY